jgi:D-alanyl-D-alanine carboxypeptidase
MIAAVSAPALVENQWPPRVRDRPAAPEPKPLLSMNIGADGLKTGHLAASGYGPVGPAVHNGHRLILVLYGARSEAQRASEADKLMKSGFHSL